MPRTRPEDGSRPDPLDKGLNAAFGPAQAPPARASVLGTLRAHSGEALSVHLDAQETDDSPVLVTEAVKELRDPSGRYQVLGEIGRGGVGVVYKGRDTDLGRDVAMKVLKDELAGRPDALARFVEEAQIGGQLQHPGIVPVYELGLQAGERPYFAMKLVKGETLAEQLARRADPAEDRRRVLGIFEQVCQTIAYAHARRVVHRDLKPSNVMIGAFGEVQVVDWGLAKVLPKGGVADEANSVARASERSVIETVRTTPGSGSGSLAGSVFGTPAYMPPEQAQGDVERLDRRSDVFGLGAILCEVLTGEPPYREADGDVLRQAANAELDGAYERLRECGADESLIELCIECLARARAARPESAAEVAQRVGAYLTSVEERARTAELRAAQARYKTRTTRITATAGLGVVLLAAGAWIWVADQAQSRRVDAEQRVAAAMSAASGAHGRAQAQAVGSDLALWDAARSSAAQAVELARSGDVGPGARVDAERLLAAVEEQRERARTEAARRERDRVMLARLETLRIPVDDDVRNHGWQVQESRRLDAEYASAFVAYLGGSSLFEQPVETSLESLRDGDIENTLAATLDHWSLVRDRLHGAQAPSTSASTARIRELALRLDPGDPWRTALREMLPEAWREGEQLRALAQETDFGSISADGCRVLAEALCHAGEKQAGVTVLQRAQELYPQDFSLCVDLALHLELLDEPRWDEAITAYRIADALRSGRADVLHRQGVALERLERHVDAERVYRRVLARDQESPHVLCHLGWVLDAQGRSDEALDAFQRALALDPEWADAHKMIGASLVERGEVEQGIEHYRRAVASVPSNPVHLYNLGTVLMNAGELDEAVEWLQRAVELAPRDTAAHANLGWALSERSDLEEACEHFERALELDPEHVRVHYNLGNTYRRLGRPRKAAECYERALALAPRDDAALVNLGNVLSSLGELERAIQCYERALEIDPENASTHHNLAVTLEDDGRLEEAAEGYRRALEVDPEFGRSQRRLMRLEHRGVLEDVLTGRREPDSSDQWANAVLFGCEKRRFHEVVALTEATLRSAPRLVEDDYSAGAYNSACAALRLAADADAPPDESERSRLRELARVWLADDVARWTDRMAEGGERLEDGRRHLELALTDPDFASVRGDALADLLEAERGAWSELWSEIDRALGR